MYKLEKVFDCELHVHLKINKITDRSCGFNIYYSCVLRRTETSLGEYSILILLSEEQVQSVSAGSSVSRIRILI